MKSIYERVLGYDIIKALAIFLIVLYHLNSVDFGQVPNDGWYFPNVTKFIYAICSSGVPLFFMVSGALQSTKIMMLSKCIKKSMRLLIVAVGWSLLFTCVLYPVLRGSDYPSIGQFQNYYWFLYTLAILYWITFLLGKSKTIRVIVVSLLILFPFFSNFIWLIIIAVDPNVSLPSWGHTGVFTLYSVVYYYLGSYLASHDITRKTSISVTIIGVFLVNFEVIVRSTYEGYVYDGVNASFPTIGALFISAGLFSILKTIKKENCPYVCNLLSFVGKNTIGVYIFHLFFVWLVSSYLFHNLTQNILFVFIAAFCIVLLTSVISNYILNSKIYFLLKL